MPGADHVFCQTTSWRCFLLSAGLSLQLKSEVSQIVNLNYGEGPEQLVKKIDAEGVVRRPFVNRSFFIATGVNVRIFPRLNRNVRAAKASVPVVYHPLCLRRHGSRERHLG